MEKVAETDRSIEILDQTLPSEDSSPELPPKTFVKKQEIPRYKVNSGILMLYVVGVALNGICQAWTTGGNNQTASVFAAKLNWTA